MIRFIATLFGLLIILCLVGAGGVLWGFYHYGKDLPDHTYLADYDPKVMTRVYAGDGRLLAEYAIEKRVFVPIEAMPRRILKAFLSAEDKSFYSHAGVNPLSIARAMATNLKNLGTGKRPVGASTITQQVAKNFLLTNEVSITRKAKEAILSLRLEKALSKDRILELYLNEIYLGFGSYGVAAAALNYFNKSLDQLTIAEIAYLAALPKAPNNYHPIKKLKEAIERRNWVIGRMQEDRVISADEAEQAKAEPLKVVLRSDTEFVKADFFAEEVRRELAKQYGENDLYEGGLSVRTTIDPRLQAAAEKALRDGLEAYDRRHGYRGPMDRLPEGTTYDSIGNWREKLKQAKILSGLEPRVPAVVMAVDDMSAKIGMLDGKMGTIPLQGVYWARPWLKNEYVGARPKKVSDVLKVGDVIAVEPLVPTEDQVKKGEKIPPNTYALWQLPEINGGIVALDPHTGRVLAMVGGYSFEASKFNRAVQANRQPGSAFKPFVYLAALDEGYTPATLILDAPFVIDQGPGLPKWRPANYTKKFYGPSTMRLGIEKSRNLMTVRLAQTVGMDKIVDYARKFDIVDDMPETLAMSLGAGETTLLRLTAAYGMLVNGGKQIAPSFIDRIQDRKGKTVFRHDTRECPKCQATVWENQPVPVIEDIRPAVTSPASAYQTVSMLEGVVERGTGRKIKAVGKPLAGKTGTTNNSVDTWFMGFSPDLAVGVFAGFDNPRSLGKNEQGASVAAPIFRDFMAEALKNQPAIPFRVPPGIRLVRVDAATGQLARPGARNVILEAFKPGTVPTKRTEVLRGYGAEEGSGAPALGTGGLY